MHISLKQPGYQIKTMRSQLSNLDMFSKLESNFLQKFFKYNLNDYFQQTFLNVYQDILNKKIKTQNIPETNHSNRLQKYITTSMFVAANKFTTEQFEKNMQKFYNEKSPSIQQNQLPIAFKLKYSNIRAVPNLIKSGELVFVDVKLKIDVQKIQEFPQKIIKYLQTYKNGKKNKLSPFQEILTNYRQQYFNIFLIYFGDCNFQVFNTKNYEINTIKLMGNTYKLRIHAFFVSRQALIESFKTLNKISNLEYINDLVIQFYELKRQKQRRKKIKQNKNFAKQGQQLSRQKLYMFIGVFGLVGFGFALKKLFL